MSGLKEKDKLTERAASSSGIEEEEGQEMPLFTLHRSRQLRGLVPSTKNYGDDREKTKKLKGEKIKLIAYHVVENRNQSKGNYYHALYNSI